MDNRGKQTGRRQVTKPIRGEQQTEQSRVAIVAGIAIVLVLAAAGSLFFYRSQSSAGQNPTPVPASVAGRAIDGIQCNTTEHLTYHVHAHLSILKKGKPVTVPANIGINFNKSCLYWLHTHDTSGVLHVEAPRVIRPTLGNFFDVWGAPLSSTRVANLRVKSPRDMRVYLDGKLYSRSPRTVILRDKTDITIEIGRPFTHPKPYHW